MLGVGNEGKAYILPYPTIIMEIKKKECPHCKKVVESLYDKQLDYNYNAHLLACKEKDETQD